MTFPLFEALRDFFPKAALVFVTQTRRDDERLEGVEVVGLSPTIDRVVTYNGSDSAYSRFVKLRNDLQLGRGDLVIYMPYSTVDRYRVIRDWVFFKLLNVHNAICFKEHLAWAYRYKHADDNLPKESDRIIEFVRSAGIPIVKPTGCRVDLDLEWTESKWSEWRLNGKQVMAICPGSNMQSKRWPISRYVEFGKRWHALTGDSFVVIGGPEEAALANDIVSEWSGYGYSACGARIGQTAGVLSKVRAYCGNDTGSMHLAALLGIPCVAIFSSRAPAQLWYPMGDGHAVIRIDIECKHCNLRTCHWNPPRCLDAISVGKVLKEMSKVLGVPYNAQTENPF